MAKQSYLDIATEVQQEIAHLRRYLAWLLENVDTMSVSEAANALGIGHQRIYDMCRTGILQSFTLGKQVLITKKSVDKRLEWTSKHGHTTSYRGENAYRPYAHV